MTNPILLWSLLGLSVPITIHLLSRKEGQIIRLGSIRHVQETSTQQFKGIKLNELLLLVLRCMLIFIFCLLLGGLLFSGVANQKWVVVESDMENVPKVKSIIDSLKKVGYEEHQLCDGFPTTKNDSSPQFNYWELANQLSEKKLASAVVLASNKLEHFRGKRGLLAPNLKWIGIPIEKVGFPLEAIQIANDSVYLRKGHSSPEQTYFTSERIKSSAQMSTSPPDSIRVVLVADDFYNYDRRILIASLRVIEKVFPIRMKIRESKSSSYSLANSDWCIWLSDSKMQENNSLQTIKMQASNSSNLFEHTKQKAWQITKRLDEGVALDENLTLQLAELIVPSQKLEAIARTNDLRVMPDSIAWSSNEKSTLAGVFMESADRFLIICLVVLLLIERIIAYRRNQ